MYSHPKHRSPAILSLVRCTPVEDFFYYKAELLASAIHRDGASDPSRRQAHTDACVRRERRCELSSDGALVERTLSVLEPRGSLVQRVSVARGGQR
ncbi:uncharacterized [Tachysurus ichikawai]